ncbi:hypothetical protein HDU92_005923 [Lobulomyces angularis]|nr:hypothetical protein HDU92_005923 [Lobulomyces angularis]
MLVCLLIHEMLRKTEWGEKVLFSRNQTNKSDTPLVPKSSFGWILATYNTSEAYTMEHIGLDAVMSLRFVKMCFGITGVLALINIPILLPINYFSKFQRLDQLEDIRIMKMDRFSIANVPDASSMLFSHVILSYFVTALICYFLHKNYKEYSLIAAKYLKEDGVLATKTSPIWRSGEMLQARTVIIEDVPRELRNDEKLQQWVENLEIGEVETAILDRNSSKEVEKLFEKRVRTLTKLENSYFNWTVKIEKRLRKLKSKEEIIEALKDVQTLAKFRPKLSEKQIFLKKLNLKKENWKVNHSLNLINNSSLTELNNISYDSGTKIEENIVVIDDAIDHYTEKLHRLTMEIKKKRMLATHSDTDNYCGNTGFVTFKSQKSAMIASQTILHSSFSMKSGQISMAPAPSDVIWLSSTSKIRKTIQSSIVTIISFFICFFMIVPTTAIASLVNSEIANFGGSNNDTFFLFLIKITGPPVIINTVNMNIIPYLLEYLSYFQFERTYSKVEMTTMSKYFFYLFFNVFFVFTLGSTFLTLINLILENPISVIIIITKTIPNGATFFINWIILNITSFPLLMVRPFAFFFSSFANWFAVTPRQLHEMRLFTSFISYGILYPLHVLVFVIVICYSVLAPLIIFPGLAYFGIGYLVLKHQLLFVYSKEWDAYGRHWIQAYNRTTAGLLVSQVTLVGILVSKKAPTFAVFVSLLIPMTLYFSKYCHNHFKLRTELVPLDQLSVKKKVQKVASESILSKTPKKSKSESPLKKSPLKESLSRNNLINEEDNPFKVILESPNNSKKKLMEFKSLTNFQNEEYTEINIGNSSSTKITSTKSIPELNRTNRTIFKKKSELGSMSLQITIANSCAELRSPYDAASPLSAAQVIANSDHYASDNRPASYINPIFSKPLARPWIPDSLAEWVNEGIFVAPLSNFKPEESCSEEDDLELSWNNKEGKVLNLTGDRYCDIEDYDEI